jgi:DNA-binding transcriptional regulator YdaS (Cro superfamily)
MSSTGIDEGPSIQNQPLKYLLAISSPRVSQTAPSMYAVRKAKVKSIMKTMEPSVSNAHIQPVAYSWKAMRYGTETLAYRMRNMISKSHCCFHDSYG